MRKLLVTGASGFIGSHASRFFSQRGWGVYGIDRNPLAANSCFAASRRCALPSDEAWGFLESVQPDVLLHAAGRASPVMSLQRPEMDFFGNAVLVFQLLEQLRRVSPKSRVILLSSAAVYGQPVVLPVSERTDPSPLSPYGFHKLQAESICREYREIYGMQTTALRLFSVYGPMLRRQVVYDVIQRGFKEGQVSFNATGDETRDFLHVSDLCTALDLIISQSEPAALYNVASGVETSLRELGCEISKALGLNSPLEFTGVSQPGLPQRWAADISLLEKIGFEARISLEEGLRETVEWCRAESSVGASQVR